jgi:hypothetical protein
MTYSIKLELHRQTVYAHSKVKAFRLETSAWQSREVKHDQHPPPFDMSSHETKHEIGSCQGLTWAAGD